MLQRHDRDVAGRRGPGRGQARAAREGDARVDHHDQVHAEEVGGGQPAREVEARHSGAGRRRASGRRPARRTRARCEPRGSRARSGRARRARGARCSARSRGLDRERELERHDDQGHAAADRELLIEPQSAAELSLGRVLAGPLERGTSVNRPGGFRGHSIFGCEGVPRILVRKISMIGDVVTLRNGKKRLRGRLEIILESKRRDAALRRYTPSP